MPSSLIESTGNLLKDMTHNRTPATIQWICVVNADTAKAFSSGLGEAYLDLQHSLEMPIDDDWCIDVFSLQEAVDSRLCELINERLQSDGPIDGLPESFFQYIRILVEGQTFDCTYRVTQSSIILYI